MSTACAGRADGTEGPFDEGDDRVEGSRHRQQGEDQGNEDGAGDQAVFEQLQAGITGGEVLGGDPRADHGGAMNACRRARRGLGGLVAWSTHRRCCSRCFGELDELAGQTLEHLGPQPVVGEPSRRLRLDDTGFSQHPQMVRDVGLASAGDLDEMAGAELLGRQSLDDRRPDRVAEYSDEVAIEVEVS